MSTDKFSAFMEAIQKDTGIQQEFASIKSPGALFRFSQKIGFNFSHEEIGELAQKMGFDLLSDDDLRNISGGQSMMGNTTSTGHQWYSGD